MGRAVPEKFLSAVEPFGFTPQELKTIHRRIHQSMKASFSRSYQEDDDSLRNNIRWLWRLLHFVSNGRRNDEIELEVVEAVHLAAWTAHDNAIKLGLSEAEARRSATVFAQLPLEKFVFKEIMGADDE